MSISRSLFAVGLVASLMTFSQAAYAGCAVDVNKDSAKKLEGLKGVGPATAKAIVDYRAKQRTLATKSGKKTWDYKNWATLLKVKGVTIQICAGNVTKVCFSGKPQKACPKK
jgi:DNA uptake protein ComE-like DNA-binding protein